MKRLIVALLVLLIPICAYADNKTSKICPEECWPFLARGDISVGDVSGEYFDTTVADGLRYTAPTNSVVRLGWEGDTRDRADGQCWIDSTDNMNVCYDSTIGDMGKPHVSLFTAAISTIGDNSDQQLFYVDPTAFPHGIKVLGLHINEPLAFTADTDAIFQHWDDAVGTTQTQIELLALDSVAEKSDSGEIDNPIVPSGEYVNLYYTDNTGVQAIVDGVISMRYVANTATPIAWQDFPDDLGVAACTGLVAHLGTWVAFGSNVGTDSVCNDTTAAAIVGTYAHKVNSGTWGKLVFNLTTPESIATVWVSGMVYYNGDPYDDSSERKIITVRQSSAGAHGWFGIKNNSGTQTWTWYSTPVATAQYADALTDNTFGTTKVWWRLKLYRHDSVGTVQAWYSTDTSTGYDGTWVEIMDLSSLDTLNSVDDFDSFDFGTQSGSTTPENTWYDVHRVYTTDPGWGYE